MKLGSDQFRELVESTSDWVWEVDQSLVYTYASPRVLDMLGYEPAEVIGKRPFDFMSSAEAERLALAIGEDVRQHRPLTSVENTNLHKLGFEVVLETSGIPFFGANGEFLGYRGVDRDITARKRAEDALVASEQRFRELLESTHLAAVMLDAEGRITFCNEYLLKLTGRAHEEVEGHDWFETFIPLEERDSLRELFTKARRADSIPAHFEHRVVTRQGGARLIEWDNTLLRDAAGQIVGTASLGRDLTEHRLLEEQYRQLQKLESIGRLAGGVAHDFNNLLTVINGYSDLLLGQFENGDTRRAQVAQIREAGKQAAALTQQLLAFSRRQVTHPELLNLNSLVSGTEKMFGPVVGEDIKVIIDLDPDLGQVLADEGQMHQVLMNLVVNASDAMPAGGTLTVSTRNVQLDDPAADGEESIQGPAVLLSVADTGIGMDAETQVHLFEPFYTTKPKGIGTGLGLATVYGIVRQAHGMIRVETAVGKGSRFDIYLPKAGERVTGRPAVSRTARPGGRETVMVVEDHADVRRFAAETLKLFHYEVIEAATGAEALRRFDDYHGEVSLLLTDVVMPGMDGRVLAETLKQTNPEVKVLYMSGYAENVISRGGVLEAGVEYIAKPFTPDELARKVRAVLRKTAPRRS